MIRLYFALLVMLFSVNAFGQTSSILDSVMGKQDKADNAKKETVSVPKTKETHKKFWKHSSIMYNQKSIDWVNSALKSHDEGIPLEILLPDIFAPTVKPETSLEEQQKPEEKPMEEIKIVSPQAPAEAPVFYLNSILYFAADNWSVWVNNEKISVGEKSPDLEIVKVTEKSITAIWRNSKIDLIYPNWKDALKPISESSLASNGKNIVLDTSTSDISFIIGINQTFDSAKLKIYEGEGAPTSLNSPPQSGSGPGDLQRAMQGNKQNGQQVIKPNEIKKERLGEGIDFEGAGGKNMDNYLEQLDVLKSILGK